MKQAEACVDNSAAILELQRRLELERTAALTLAGLGYEDQPVSESLAQLLTNQTTIRLGLDGHGWGIGILAFETARLSEIGEPYMAEPAARAFEETGQSELVREVFGNPFCSVAVVSVWLTETVLSLRGPSTTSQHSTGCHSWRASEDAACDNADILNHCREPGVHVRGCWVVDLLLGKK